MKSRSNFIQRENLLRAIREQRYQKTFISFHSSGPTSNQWRKLKNSWFPGRTSFRPNCSESVKEHRFFEQLTHSTGPKCILYFPEASLENFPLLPSLDSMNQDLLSLYGQHRSAFLDHMDVDKVADFNEDQEGKTTFNLFHFHLPSSYLSYVLGRD